MTNDQLPRSLSEYLDVWCADLLAPLGPTERSSFLNAVLSSHGKGPWPTRLEVQRLVEISRGLATHDAVVGELLGSRAGGIDAVLVRLADPDRRATALGQLGQLAATPAMVAKVTAAQRAGLLSATERAEVLTRALRHPLLPEPIPAPAHLPALPVGFTGPVRHLEPEEAVLERMEELVRVEQGGQGDRLVRVDPPADQTLRVGPMFEEPPVPVRAMESWVPQREGAVCFHDEADEFLRRRGWRSRRTSGRAVHRHDEWIWPPSEDEPWWQPTVIDYDGTKFRIRLASLSLAENQPTDNLESMELLRFEIAAIERWSDLRSGR